MAGAVRGVFEQLGHADSAPILRVYANAMRAMREEESDLSFADFARLAYDRTPIPFASLIRSTRSSLADRPQVRRPIQTQELTGG